MIKPTVYLDQCTVTAEYCIECAYRNCYKSPVSDNPRKFITSCIKLGHVSPLEFANATFTVTCSRATSHQIVRHRLASYTQESQRRVKVTKDWIIPKSVGEVKEDVTEFMLDAYELYEALVICGTPKEDARYVLPSAFITTLMINMNFRELRHFFRMRCDPHAQWEIRSIAKEMLYYIYEAAPSVFGDLYEKYILEQEVELWTNSD